MTAAPGDIHPAGYFDAVVKDYGLTISKTNGGCLFFLDVETQHGLLHTRFAFTEPAARYTVERIKNIGFKGDDLGSLNTDRSLVGASCCAAVKHETYEGILRASVTTVLPPNRAGRDLKDPAAVELARKYNYLLKPNALAAPKAAPPAPSQEFEEDFIVEDGPRF